MMMRCCFIVALTDITLHNHNNIEVIRHRLILFIFILLQKNMSTIYNDALTCNNITILGNNYVCHVTHILTLITKWLNLL